MSDAAHAAAQADGIDTLLAQAQEEERLCLQRWHEAQERVRRLEERRAELEAERLRASVDDASRLRESVRRLGRFTVSELAADMEMDKRIIKPMLDKLVETGIALKTGDKFGTSPIYAWAKPTSPGEAFEAQQQRRHLTAVPDRQPHAPTHGTGRNAQLQRITDKDLRAYVSDLLREGWHLEDGGKHPMLRKGSRKVQVDSTPRDGIHSVNHLRQKLRRQR